VEGDGNISQLDGASRVSTNHQTVEKGKLGLRQRRIAVESDARRRLPLRRDVRPSSLVARRRRRRLNSKEEDRSLRTRTRCLSVRPSVPSFVHQSQGRTGLTRHLLFVWTVVIHTADKMLIGLVRESVMQCFCHTCRAPTLPVALHRTQIPITKVKTKPRSVQTIANQPKRVQFVTTEVRCQEKTRGGLRYEVILGEPEAKVQPPKKQLSPKNSMSVQDIEEKLKAAEERRQLLESTKMAALSAKMSKIEEANRKRDEYNNQFITTTKEALDQKMGQHVEKREAIITDLKTKMKDHIENVEKTRLSLEQQTDEVRTAIEEKLKTASQQRDDNIKKMLERLKEHEEQVQKVREQNTVRLQQLDAAIQDKLGQARTRKEQIEQEQREKLRNHVSTAPLRPPPRKLRFR
ncbi:unnamed protein product, partial [Callosobruchus maculatus]